MVYLNGHRTSMPNMRLIWALTGVVSMFDFEFILDLELEWIRIRIRIE